jgi:hypothetical protein
MTVDFPDGVLRRLHDSWRDKLADAYCRYSDNRTAETRAEYLKVLKTFTDIVVRHQPPPDSE